MNDASLFMVSLVVPDMDDGIAHFTGDWGFSLANDSCHASGRRWVEIAPSGGARLRLIEAGSDAERSVIGRQAGGRVTFFLNVSGFDAAVTKWAANGIVIAEPRRREDYGTVAVLKDKYGNRWDVFDADDGSNAG